MKRPTSDDSERNSNLRGDPRTQTGPFPCLVFSISDSDDTTLTRHTLFRMFLLINGPRVIYKDGRAPKTGP